MRSCKSCNGLHPRFGILCASVTSLIRMPSAHSGATSAGVSSCVGTVDSKWRNRDEFFEGRDAIKAFLTTKWQKELQYKLMKELWCYQGNRISVRFEYEYHDHSGQWWRAHGNEVCPMLSQKLIAFLTHSVHSPLLSACHSLMYFVYCSTGSSTIKVTC